MYDLLSVCFGFLIRAKEVILDLTIKGFELVNIPGGLYTDLSKLLILCVL